MRGLRVFGLAAVIGVLLVMSTAPAYGAQFRSLFIAIVNNNMGTVKSLTPSGSLINAIDISSGATPLTWACMRNINPQIAAWLVSQGADVERMDGEGATPLTTAADYGNAGAVKLLLKMGANPDRPNDRGVPPLVLASGQRGNLEAVKALVESGVKVNGLIGSWAVEYATVHNKPEIVEYLTGLGAAPKYFKTVQRLFSK